MTNDAGESTETDDAALARHAAVLADALDVWIPVWMESTVRRLAGDEPDVFHLIADVRAGLLTDVRRLLDTDIDAQWTTPLALVRAGLEPLNMVLEAAGVPPAERDEQEERLQPGDIFAIAPASFADIHPELQAPGLAWGAAKAHVHLRRRRAEGMR